MIHLEPFYSASFAVQSHIVAALAALVIGGAVLFRRKGSSSHKLWGKIWVVLMMVVIVSSIFIRGLSGDGSFSAIHILSVVSFVSIIYSIYSIRKGDVLAHQRSMQGLYMGGLVFAGILTLLTGRLMNQIVFGPENTSPLTDMNPLLAAFGVALLAFLIATLWPRIRNRTEAR